MAGTVRTRFAPSPTGELHLGNARIAVLNWLYARHENGRFVLRIEDTDPERNVPGAEREIMRSLRRLGLDWDEGPDSGGEYGPYRQSEREDHYRSYAERLLAAGAAYHCYCTQEELEARLAGPAEGGDRLRYDGRCRELIPEDERRLRERGAAASLRFAVPAGDVVVQDLVRGDVRFDSQEFGDFVIMKSDGGPTYNFAVVVDDLAMSISHVIRGAGHLSNTPRQLMLYRALSAEPPIFVHVPHVLAPDGSPLSKRHGARTLGDYLDAGYHPSALVNYLSLLSWSSPTGEEVLSVDRLIEEIDLARLGASEVRLDPDKLKWLSGEHIRRMRPEALAERLQETLDRDAFPGPPQRRVRTAAALQERIDTFSEAAELLPQLNPPDPMRWNDAAQQALRGEKAERVVKAVHDRLSTVEHWSGAVAIEAVRAAGRDIDVKGRELFMPVRAALTGAVAGPELVDVLAVQGRATALRVLDQALEFIRQTSGARDDG